MLYTGAEIALGAWTYTLLTELRGIDPKIAGLVAGSYWASFTVGRVLAGLFVKRIGVNTLVQGGLLAALSGTILLWWNPSGTVSMLGVAITGFAIAPIFPGLVSGTSQRVSPKFAANTIGMQMGGAGLGGASIPAMIGILARRTSLEIIPICLFTLFAVLFGLYLISVQVKDRQTSEALEDYPLAGGE